MDADDLSVRRDLVIPADELQVSASRAGGPGGQNVNKVSTRVTLRWSVAASRALTDAQRGRLLARLGPRLTTAGELLVRADTTRSQHTNRALARERLAEIVREALVVPRTRVRTKPTRASRKRRVDAKKRRSQTKRRRGRPSPDD